MVCLLVCLNLIFQRKFLIWIDLDWIGLDWIDYETRLKGLIARLPEDHRSILNLLMELLSSVVENRLHTFCSAKILAEIIAPIILKPIKLIDESMTNEKIIVKKMIKLSPNLFTFGSIELPERRL